MTEIVGIVRAQLDALLELLQEARETYCKDTMARAREEARGYVARARRTARERVGRAVGDERERIEREVRLAAAALETEQRRLGRQRDLELIRAGWKALEKALHERWEDDAGRREWAAAAVEEAGRMLLGKDWKVEHPEGWPGPERDAAADAAKSRFGAGTEFEASPEVAAGLRIRHGGTLIDMTPAGILAHKRAIEAELLAEFGPESPHGAGDEHD